jgi:hypothetical protein
MSRITRWKIITWVIVGTLLIINIYLFNLKKSLYEFIGDEAALSNERIKTIRGLDK